MEGWLIPFQHC